MCQVVVPREHRFVLFSQLRRKFLSHTYGAVLTARAADGNSQITAVRVFKSRNPAIEEAGNVFVHRYEAVVRIQKLDHLAIKSCQATQFDRPVWVRQATHVENEIGVRRDSMFVTKGFDQYRKRFRFSTVDPLPDYIGEFINTGLGRINDQISCIIDLRQDFTLGVDRHAQLRAVCGKRVSAAGFTVALQQNFVTRVHKHDVCANALATQVIKSSG